VRVTWSPSALREIALAVDYLTAFNPRAAARLAETLLATGNILAHFPHRGRRVAGSEMRQLVTAYPYFIRYRIVPGEVRILRVRHSSRPPADP
jgi:plasmid stabilization system protein ParE